MPKVQNRALLKFSRYDPLIIFVSSTKPSIVPAVFTFFSLERPHLCAPCDILDVEIQPRPNADVPRPCRRQACVIIERDMGSPLESNRSFTVGCKEKGAA